MQDETRIVTMVLSNVSISISSAFTSDLVSSARFHYVKKPKSHTEVAKEQDEAAAKRRRKKEEEEQLAFGTYASRAKFTYRVRKAGAFGGYKIVTEVRVGGLGYGCPPRATTGQRRLPRLITSVTHGTLRSVGPRRRWPRAARGRAGSSCST